MTSLERSDDCRGRRRVWASDLNKISFGLGILNLAAAVMNELSEEWGGSVVVAKPEEETTPSTLACRRWPGAASAYLIFKPEREALLVLAASQLSRSCSR